MKQVYHGTDNLPLFGQSVITIGTFDGVHLGHRQIISQLIREAEKCEGTPIVVTFHPHPKQVVQQDRKPILMLNTPEEKYQLLHEAGINHIIVVPFDRAFAEQSADQYVREFLVNKLRARVIVIGYDHRFGHNRAGDYHLLDSLSAGYGFQVREIPERVIRNTIISSTRIREALLAGDIEGAAELLGYRYFFSGEVVQGNKLGRTIGYPTANLRMENNEKLVPANGVYIVEAYSHKFGQRYNGMMNIGTRPTVDGSKRAIEVHLLDFDGDLYDSTLRITLHKKLREETKFAGLDELKQQLAKDKDDTARYWAGV